MLHRVQRLSRTSTSKSISTAHITITVVVVNEYVTHITNFKVDAMVGNCLYYL